MNVDKMKVARPLVEAAAGIRGAFMTGSAAIGGFTPNESDVDIVIPIEEKDAIRSIVETGKELGFVVQQSDYNNGIKLVKPIVTVVNFVCLHPLDYCGWLFATQTLKQLDGDRRDRNGRHRMFELAVLLFKCATVGTGYMTVDGARRYYDMVKPDGILERYDYLIQYHSKDLPF